MGVTNSRIKHIDGLRGITILAVVFLLRYICKDFFPYTSEEVPKLNIVFGL